MNPPQLSLEFHPFANMFPLLSEADSALLRKSLKETGQLDAIVLLDGKILEGRNRYRELFALGIAPVTEEYDPITHGPDPLEYVWAKNYIRRHLSASQRGAVAAEYAKAKADAQGGKGKTDAVNDAAAQMHVAPSQVHNAAKLQTEAPDLFDKVKEGATTIHAATVELQHRQHPETAPQPGAGANVLQFPTTPSTDLKAGTVPLADAYPNGVPGDAPKTHGAIVIPTPDPEEQPAATGTKPAKKKAASKKKGGAKSGNTGDSTPPAEGAPEGQPAATTPAPAPAEPTPDKAAEELKKLRSENFATVKHLHGDEFATAFKTGAVLKSVKEVKAFVKCNDNEQTLIVPYIVAGWDVARASKFVIRSIDLKDPIQDLVYRFNATGSKKETFKVGGFKITVEKA